LVFGKPSNKPTYGRAYFLLVTEFRQRGIPFLSLTAAEQIPAQVRAVITTRAESMFVRHPRVVIYDECDPREKVAEIVDRAIRTARGKDIYDELVIGVDPGERIGVAAIADGKIWKVGCCSGAGKAATIIGGILKDVEARRKVVRVGANSKSHQYPLILALNQTLPSNVELERVPEESTTRESTCGRPRRRGLRDINSAVKISTRKGRSIKRGP